MTFYEKQRSIKYLRKSYSTPHAALAMVSSDRLKYGHTAKSRSSLASYVISTGNMLHKSTGYI